MFKIDVSVPQEESLVQINTTDNRGLTPDELSEQCVQKIISVSDSAHPAIRDQAHAFGNFMCTSFKKELMTATHNFTNSSGNTFKLALYTNSASFNAATTAYTTSNEVGNSGTYSAGGGTLTNVTPTTSGTTALTDFADLTFTSATITARGALIYNDSATGDPSVVVLDFGSDKSSTSGDFQIVFPTADASNAIIRIA